MTAQQDAEIAATFQQQRKRLQQFIARHIADRGDAEDILQDVFYELIDAYRLMKPVEQLGAWLMRVARNRIVDRFRRRAHPTAPVLRAAGDDDSWEDLLPSPDAGPEAAFAHQILIEQLEAALEELPAPQREVFIAHELQGRSFNDMAAEQGVSVNTLLARKHAAVQTLRERLLDIYQEFRD